MKAKLIKGICVIVLGNLATYAMYCVFRHELINPLEILQFPFAILAVVLFFCLIHKQTITRYIENEPSTVDDVFWTILHVSSFYKWLMIMFSFGVGYGLNTLIELELKTNLLTTAPLYTQFLVTCIVVSFASYWHHRLLHTEILWPFHEIHHSATHFNGITSFRVHPIDATIGATLTYFPVAILGIGPTALATYAMLNILYQIWVHTEFTVGWKPLNKLLITPELHRIHHSFEKENYNKNFSSLTIWDKLFKTYKEN